MSKPLLNISVYSWKGRHIVDRVFGISMKPRGVIWKQHCRITEVQSISASLNKEKVRRELAVKMVVGDYQADLKRCFQTNFLGYTYIKRIAQLRNSTISQSHWLVTVKKSYRCFRNQFGIFLEWWFDNFGSSGNYFGDQCTVTSETSKDEVRCSKCG